MEESFNFILKYTDDATFESGIDERVFARSDDDKKKYYFIKIEKIYLGNTTFPFQINYNAIPIYEKFAVMCLQKDKKYEDLDYEAVIEYDGNPLLLADSFELIRSQMAFCERVNSHIKTALEYFNTKISGYKYLYYPEFTVFNGELLCEYTMVIGENGSTKLYVLGFGKNLFHLLGKYFRCEYGAKIDETTNEISDRYYFVYPFNTADKIKATYQVNDFFYQEKNLYVETTRAVNPTFTEEDVGYKYQMITFRENEGVHEVNKYILIADNATIDENEVTTHRTRCKIKNNPWFLPDMDGYVIVKAKLVYTIDYFDNFVLFNVNVGDMYTEEEYEQLTFKKLVSITARNVYVENNLVHKLLLDIHDRFLNHFKSLEDMSTDNISQLVKNIYTILNQTQEITELGPPSTKLSKIDFN